MSAILAVLRQIINKRSRGGGKFKVLKFTLDILDMQMKSKKKTVLGVFEKT